MASYAKGVLTTISGVAVGYIQSIEATGEADEYMPLDNKGDAFLVEGYNGRQRLTVQVRADRDATALPELNDAVAISGSPGDLYDGNFTVIAPPSGGETNTDGPTFTLNLIRLLSNVYPAST